VRRSPGGLSDDPEPYEAYWATGESPCRAGNIKKALQHYQQAFGERKRPHRSSLRSGHGVISCWATFQARRITSRSMIRLQSRAGPLLTSNLAPSTNRMDIRGILAPCQRGIKLDRRARRAITIWPWVYKHFGELDTGPQRLSRSDSPQWAHVRSPHNMGNIYLEKRQYARRWVIIVSAQIDRLCAKRALPWDRATSLWEAKQHDHERCCRPRREPAAPGPASSKWIRIFTSNGCANFCTT